MANNNATLFDTDTLALLLTLFIIYNATIKRRNWWMNVSLKPASLLVYHKDQRTGSVKLTQLGQLCDVTTGSSPGRGIEQLPYFYSLEVLLFTPMALGVSLGIVTLTRFITGQRDAYSPFFIGAVMCTAFPVILSSWRAARSSDNNQVAALLTALIITPIACFNTSTLFGIEPPNPKISLDVTQQGFITDLGLTTALSIIRAIVYLVLYIGLLMGVYTVVGPAKRSTELLYNWITGGDETEYIRDICNSICVNHPPPSSAAVASPEGNKPSLKTTISRYVAFLGPMVLPLLFAPSTTPLPISSIGSLLYNFLPWAMVIITTDYRTYAMFPGVVQQWLLTGDDGRTTTGLDSETRYLRSMYTAVECAIIPRFITIFAEIDLALRILPDVFGLVQWDNTVDLSSIIPLMPDNNTNDIDYSKYIPRLRRAISEVWRMILPPIEVMKWSKIYVGTLTLAFIVVMCGTLVFRSTQISNNNNKHKAKSL